jgi:hypothetical protein
MVDYEIPQGTMHIKGGIPFKIGSHGHTYRWTGDEWRRSANKLEKINGGYALHVQNTKPRVRNDFASPASPFVMRRNWS